MLEDLDFCGENDTARWKPFIVVVAGIVLAVDVVVVEAD